MPEQREPQPTPAAAGDQLRAVPGLIDLVAEAEAVWLARAVAAGDSSDGRPCWRTFEDSFPTFYEFTNRPR
jgi:hypothetical protein